MERKFTDEEIVKALEICSKNNVTRHNELTYEGMPLRFLFEDALDLINRQKAEIADERAREELCAEVIKRLDKESETARAEAIKEFAGRLKASAFECDVSFGYGREHYTEAVAVVEIDTLVKEMTGENNGN